MTEREGDIESESFISFFWDEPSEIPDINLASSYTHEWQVNVRVERGGGVMSVT